MTTGRKEMKGMKGVNEVKEVKGVEEGKRKRYEG